MKTPAGDEIDSVETDDDGPVLRSTCPGPGEYVVSLDAKSLPEGVSVGAGGDSRTVTVEPAAGYR